MQTKNLRDAILANVEYDPEHPKHGLCVQRMAHKRSLVMTVTFTGQLSEYQTEEESLRGGYPKTTVIVNDLAEILLGLIEPWNRLPLLFQQYVAEYEMKRDASAKVWNIVEPTLSSHNRNFARILSCCGNREKTVALMLCCVYRRTRFFAENLGIVPRLRAVPSNSTFVYTDGSGIDNHVGAAAVSPLTRYTRIVYIGKSETSTVYTTELQGIKLALQIVDDDTEKGNKRDKVIIFTDN